MVGNGYLKCADGQSYQGEFDNGKLHGEGIYRIENGTYSLAGKWTHGQAEFEANKYLLDVLSPPEEEEEQNKAKGKPPAKGAAPIEEDVFLNEKRIKIDVSNPDEVKRKLGLAIKVVF